MFSKLKIVRASFSVSNSTCILQSQSFASNNECCSCEIGKCVIANHIKTTEPSHVKRLLIYAKVLCHRTVEQCRCCLSFSSILSMAFSEFQSRSKSIFWRHSFVSKQHANRFENCIETSFSSAASGSFLKWISWIVYLSVRNRMQLSINFGTKSSDRSLSSTRRSPSFSLLTFSHPSRRRSSTLFRSLHETS